MLLLLFCFFRINKILHNCVVVVFFCFFISLSEHKRQLDFNFMEFSKSCNKFSYEFIISNNAMLLSHDFTTLWGFLLPVLVVSCKLNTYCIMKNKMV